jgi:hypothetical protein
MWPAGYHLDHTGIKNEVQDITETGVVTTKYSYFLFIFIAFHDFANLFYVIMLMSEVLSGLDSLVPVMSPSSSSLALRPIFGPWPSYLLPLPRLQLRFRDKSKFYVVELSAPRPTPNLEDQGILICLGHHL